MTQAAAVWLVLVVAIVAANLPFFSERLLVVGPRRAPKAFAWRLLELLILWGLTLALGFALEAQLGQRSPQQWEFFVATGCLFLTLASPGFVWRQLRKPAKPAFQTAKELHDGIV
ncbi:MAG TPA: DUF2818 family protein [Ideonella sp.]|uniref:DUF2818 family protein n=1 Tax=Ideonella sp. TaxID=1929293 RepID=UPI002BE5F1A4|nr:DUF2818 family protein [Ideonella sp.]HSI51464.1 DUF2818 family protein [Ideonella sp.]